MTTDPGELLSLIGDFDGARDASLPPGVVSVAAFSVGMAPPIKTGDLTKDRAALRAYHGARFMMPDSSCSAESVSAWEAMAQRLPQQQAEARELWYQQHPDQRPEPEHVREAPPAKGWTAADAIYRTPLKRR